mmetsp:Transcript_28784/g.54685  ORF Transcript_28784/g.54685 Transcript_28784/m.54685 type:complete len:125 (-) Transcript_28784:5507-5881(-)
MPIAAFLQFLGFVLVAINTTIAGFAIYVFQTGGRNLDDLFSRAIAETDVSTEFLVWATVIIGWAVVSLPAFLLWANGLNTEAAIQQVENARQQKKDNEQMHQALIAIRNELIASNEKLQAMVKK